MTRFIVLLALVGSLSAVGCRGGSNQFVETAPTPKMEFDASLMRASEEAAAGRYDVADRLLNDFATRNPASAPAIDALYWRALFKLDPANAAASAREAAALLESYVSSPESTRRGEAATLRRVALALEQRPAVITVPTQAKAEQSGADKAKDEEISRLKDELMKANAELERIKRRLSKP